MKRSLRVANSPAPRQSAPRCAATGWGRWQTLASISLWVLLAVATLAPSFGRAADAAAGGQPATSVAKPAKAAKPAAAVSTNAPGLPFEKEILAFEAADKTNPPPQGAILFVGSSSIRMWKTLAADFPQHQVINRGFGGSQIADSIRYCDRIIVPYRPRLVVVYAGGNDLNAKKSPDRVFADYRELVFKIHRSLPETRIAYISVAPNPARWSQIEQVRALNRNVEEFTRKDPRLRFIDVHPGMLGPDGTPKPEIFVADRLHMNAEGYRLWTRIVAPYLAP
jgi:lysophospholipase L1-like esterase